MMLELDLHILQGLQGDIKMSLKGKKEKTIDVTFKEPLRELSFKEKMGHKLIDENISRHMIENSVYDGINETVQVKVDRIWDYAAKAILPSLLWKYTGKKDPVKLVYRNKTWTAKFK